MSSTCTGGSATSSHYYGYGHGLIVLDNVQCSGFESNLLSCQHNGIGVVTYCDHSKDAGVQCLSSPAENCSNGELRLVGGDVANEGRVEICYGNRWGTVCHDDWGSQDAAVACHQLGYSGLYLHEYFHFKATWYLGIHFVFMYRRFSICWSILWQGKWTHPFG